MSEIVFINISHSEVVALEDALRDRGHTPEGDQDAVDVNPEWDVIDRTLNVIILRATGALARV